MKKKMLIILSLLLAIAIGILYGAITKETDTKDTSLETILEKKELVLGLDDSFPPMGFRNEKNEIVGFDIDVAKEVAKRMGVSLKLQPISWAAKVEELNTKKIDCIWNGMSIDEERKAAMNLSFAYMENNMVFVTKLDGVYNTKESLVETKVGLQTGSTAQKILEESEFANSLEKITSYTDNITAFLDLEMGQIQAVFVDEVLANYYITSQNKNYQVLKEKMAREEYAIGFRKADESLKKKVEEILVEMKQDGTISTIATKWFGSDITLVKEGP